MPISIEDHIDDPDAFLQKALQSKVDALSARIDALITTGKDVAELERLLKVRADFMEVLRSPRFYLARPPGTPAPGPASPAGGGMGVRTESLPPGAIPQPRRVGTTEPTVPPAGTPPPAQPVPAAPPAKSGNMLSFLKNIQANAPAGAAPSPTPAPGPATPAAPGVPAAGQAAGQSVETLAGGPPSKGQMLSFLEQIRSAASAPAAVPGGGPKVRELTYENKKAIIEMIKQRAATTGFQDIYEMLNYKREKLLEHRANLLKTTSLPPHQVTVLIDREIAEIDDLLMKRPQEILPQVQEFDEVASVDTGGLAAIRKELKGLLDEIK